MNDSPRDPHEASGFTAADQHQFRSQLSRAVVWPVVVTLVLTSVFLALIALLLNSARWVEHTGQVIAQTHLVERLLIDRESGLRGYLLTDNPDFLAPYVTADAVLPTHTATLAALVADNPAQLERLQALGEQRQAWEAFAQEALSRFEAGNDYQSFVAAGIGKARMDSMRVILDQMVSTEEALREKRAAMTEQFTLLVVGGSFLLALLLGALLAWLTRRQLMRLTEQYGRALGATARAATRLRALHAIDRAILARTPLPQTVAGALQRLAPLVGSPRAVAIFDLLPHVAPVQLVVDPDCVRTQVAASEMEAIAGLFAARQTPEQLVLPLKHLHSTPLLVEPLAKVRVTNALLAPLRSDGRLSGVLALGVPPEADLSPDVITLVGEVTNQLTIALQQEWLQRDVASHTAELEERVAARTAALEVANAELEAFGYSVAHDLRAPVRAMQSFAAALLEDYGAQLDELGRDYARRIMGASERMEVLINDLLAYSRLSRAELTFGRVALRQALDDALAQLDEAIAERGAVISVDEPLPVVVGHRTTLAQVIANLLANAMTFVAPGTTPAIAIHAVETNGWARLEVRDNGIGIAPEHQQRIFRVFERLHSIEQYPGTGIGLAIVRKGVERMGGRVGLESRLGQGSTFWIELPTRERSL